MRCPHLQTSLDYYTLDTYQIPVGTGSGFIWDRKGHVITNYHVVRGAKQVQVTLIDGRTLGAKVVGAEGDKDVAVLQLDLPTDESSKLTPVDLGNSSNLVVGQKVGVGSREWSGVGGCSKGALLVGSRVVLREGFWGAFSAVAWRLGVGVGFW